METQQSASATLPKCFRCHDESSPKTPEPLAAHVEEELMPPRRPPRLRLKRRHASQLHAPTQQFLASIAAADVPIPSVEHGRFEDQEMPDTLHELHVQDVDEIHTSRPWTPRLSSPPKTPAIELLCTAPAQYPDWYDESSWSDLDHESSPDYESSRPSTAFSTQTSSSLSSMYSQLSEEENCISPDFEIQSFLETKQNTIPSSSRSDRPRRAPWTRAMSSHLWATYKLYLSDPRVTPIRVGKSSIPPHGVCARVARQAQRSWRGSHTQNSALNSGSGSTTPTAGSANPFMQWPHTPAATRAHLRELCKLEVNRKFGRYSSQTPTPCSQAAQRRWNRRSTPARSPSVFSARGMVMSLAISTSDTMQPHGPLAELAKTWADDEAAHTPCLETYADNENSGQELHASLAENMLPVEEQTIKPYPKLAETCQREPSRLGSPFMANSYGPSSSSIATKLSLPKQPNTVGPRNLLKSPVRLNRSRSGTQKRRSTKGEEEKRAWQRPSLAAAFFREGSRGADGSDSLIKSSHAIETQPNSHDCTETTVLGEMLATPAFVASARSPGFSPTRPPRLGSPFSASGASYSFPNRLSSAGNFSLAALRRPFATVQPSSHLASESNSAPRSSLATRLAYLDQRLRDFRNRGGERRRSQSPL